MGVFDRIRELTSFSGIPQLKAIAELTDMITPMMPSTEASNPAELASGVANTAANRAGNREGSFVSAQSFLSFSGISVVITVTWRLAKSLGPTSEWVQSPFFPFIMAVLAGIAFLVLDLADPERTTRLTRRDYFLKVIYTIVNTIFLACSVLGVDTAAANASNSTSGGE